MVVVEAPVDSLGAPRTPALLEVLATEGILYERLYPDPQLLSLLTLPDGGPLTSRLHEYGYATSLVATQRDAGLGAGFAEVDDQPGGPS